jgi:hypothetical protein
VATTDQGALNLVMKIEPNNRADHFKALQTILAPPKPGQQSPMRVALDRLRTVHFARFFFIEDQYLCLATSYDGRFEDYVNDFVEVIGPIFDNLLKHLANAPRLPVAEYRHEFIEYVREHNLPTAGGEQYSAYPGLSVVRILFLAGGEAHRTG